MHRYRSCAIYMMKGHCNWIRLDWAGIRRGRGGGRFGEDNGTGEEMGIKNLEGEEDTMSSEMDS